MSGIAASRGVAPTRGVIVRIVGKAVFMIANEVLIDVVDDMMI